MNEEMVTSEQGIRLYKEVGLSENTFYRHVRENKIRKVIEGERQRGALYYINDIEKIVKTQRIKRNERTKAIVNRKEEYGKTDWVTASDLPRLLVLDYDMYGIEEAVDLSITHHWWIKNPYMCRVLYNAKDRKDIWGYITTMPMEEKIIFELLQRRMHERDIRPEHILTYEKGRNYAVYAASVVIKPEHQFYLRELIYSMLNFWCSLYPEINILKIYAYADSDDGWKLIKHLYFSPRYDIGERAFELDLRQLNPSKLVQAFQDSLKNRRQTTLPSVHETEKVKEE